MFALALSQLVLIEAPQDAVRTDHNQRLMFGRSAAVAATPGAPWYLWKRPAVQIEPEEDARRGDTTLLHQYRETFQTVGQSYRLWPRAQQRIEQEEYSIPTPVDLTDFRNSQPAVATAGQPFFLWPEVVANVPEAEDGQRVNHQLLHRYRAGYQTVGQSWQYWIKPQARVDDEQYTVPPPASLYPYRQISVAVQVSQPYWLWPQTKVDVPQEDDAQRVNQTLLHRYRFGFQTVGQSWYLWPAAKPDLTIEPDAQRSDHGLIHRYRVGYQTVGQSWQYWIKPQQRVDEEPYPVPPPASLYPYRQIVITAQPGQPWYMWPAAKADQSVEPNPVVIDHAALLYPFRPHDAVQQIQEVEQVSRGNWNLLKPGKKPRRIRYSDYESQEAYAAALALAAMPIARITDTSELVSPEAGIIPREADDDDEIIINAILMHILYDR
jgi:hypothetical protein